MSSEDFSGMICDCVLTELNPATENLKVSSISCWKSLVGHKSTFGCFLLHPTKDKSARDKILHVTLLQHITPHTHTHTLSVVYSGHLGSSLCLWSGAVTEASERSRVSKAGSGVRVAIGSKRAASGLSAALR